MARDQYEPDSQNDRDDANEARELIREELERERVSAIEAEMTSEGADAVAILYGDVVGLDVKFDDALGVAVADALRVPSGDDRDAQIGRIFLTLINEAVERLAKTRVRDSDIDAEIARRDDHRAADIMEDRRFA